MVWFFNFDDTLCIHNYNNGLTQPVDFYNKFVLDLDLNMAERRRKDDIPLDSMKWMVDECLKEGDICICLSAETSSLRNSYIRGFLDKHYSKEMGFVSVCSQDAKIDFIRAYAITHELSMSECTLVDNSTELCIAAAHNGIQSLTVGGVEYWHKIEGGS